MAKQLYYTDERNIQILISLLKQRGIKKIIASPGATNVSFVGSLQNDPFFEMYSCVDERSAAFMACGLAAESGEPVVLSCTGATSSQNYLSGLTEAYYRKLPVLAVTSTQDVRKIGHMIAQVTDRSVNPNDTFVHSSQVHSCNNAVDEWDATIRLNRALLALTRNGGGPVHVNLETTYSQNYNIKKIPTARLINRITIYDKFPQMPSGRVAVFVGAHMVWSKKLTDAVDRFCTKYGAVVFCDHSSNYKSYFCVHNALVGSQSMYTSPTYKTDLLIHIGEITADYANTGKLGLLAKNVWRVSPDGELRDQFKKLSCVFEMNEESFFSYYAGDCKQTAKTNSYLEECQTEYKRIFEKIGEYPLSNPWIAQKTSKMLPKGSVLHIGILNSLRAWNLFEIDSSISSYINTGGFGIDGIMSSCIGGALVQPEKMHYLVIGDLAFC